jgi:microcystin-dependent protein
MADPFLGQITVYPYSFPPLNWMDCNGALIPISQNVALFSLLGTYYGGNGTSNFALPNLQGFVPLSQGQLPGGGFYSMGETGGVTTVTLTQSTMPAHTHALNATTTTGTTNAPLGALLAKAQVGGGRSPSDQGKLYNPAQPNTAMPVSVITPAGGSLPHNNIQPTLVLRYCICVRGIFPSRS